MDSRPHPAQIATLVLFFALLLSPWIGRVAGLSHDTLENRADAPFPDVGPAELGQVGVYREIGDFVTDRAALRQEAIGAVAWIGSMADIDTSTRVVSGPGDVLLLAEDFTLPCGFDRHVSAFADSLGELHAAAQTGDRRFVFAIAPNKSTVFDDALTGRADAAAWCARAARAALRSSLDDHPAAVDLFSVVDRPDLYFTTDTHWTHAAGSVVASELVDELAAGLWDPDAVSVGEPEAFRGDIAAMAGVERIEFAEPRSVVRPGATMATVETDLEGQEPMRTYQTTGVPTIPGRTVVVFDSMMHFVEAQLAPYFEHVTFVHWQDLDREPAAAAIGAADTHVWVSIERYVPVRARTKFLDPDFVATYAATLEAPRS